MPARRTAILAGLGLAAGCALTGTGSGYRKGPLPIAAGDVDGVYYTYGWRLAYRLDRRIDGVHASADVTTGSVDNLHRLSIGRDQLAFVAADAAGRATTRPAADLPLGALARLYDDYIHLVAAASTPYRSIADLRGRRIAVGAKGSGVELVAGRVLAAAGLGGTGAATLVRMGLEESAPALREGLIDAFFWSGGLPTSGITRLAEQMPLRLIPLGGLATRIRGHYGPYYRAATVPRGTYPNIDEAMTVAVANFLVAPIALDEELVYRVTEVLIRDRDAIASGVPSAELLNVRNAIQTDPVPLHPGAARYYRSIKL